MKLIWCSYAHGPGVAPHDPDAYRSATAAYVADREQLAALNPD